MKSLEMCPWRLDSPVLSIVQLLLRGTSECNHPADQRGDILGQLRPGLSDRPTVLTLHEGIVLLLQRIHKVFLGDKEKCQVFLPLKYHAQWWAN